VTSSTPYYRGGVTRERFDAQSWALIQFLIFGYKDNAGPRFDRLIQQLASGVPADAAVASVYGSVAALEDAYLLYVQQSVYSYGRLPTNTAIVEEKLPARQASPAEHAGVRAAFHVTMNRPAEARALIAASRTADAAAPFADDAEALLLDREQQTEQARELFARAAAAGSTSYWTYYRLASLSASTAMSTDERAALVPWLEQATSLNPQSAAGFAFLADIQASVNRTDAAIAASRRAVDLDKGNVTHHLRLARLLVAATRLDEARAVAREALPLATPQQRAMLESVIGSAGN
jgi:tetratricopeptide (TPR) repeat protein